MAFAFFEPNRSWGWGVLPMVGQFVWMLLSQGPGNLLPLGVIVFGVLSSLYHCGTDRGVHRHENNGNKP
jgi:hypothetical protein